MLETPREGDQPLPIVRPDVPDVQSSVIDDIQKLSMIPDYIRDTLIASVEERRQVGIERYGTALQPFNGRDAFRDAFEEALDLVMYLKQLVMEGNPFGALYHQALNLLLNLKRRTP